MGEGCGSPDAAAEVLQAPASGSCGSPDVEEERGQPAVST
jgi:hypothetical protein